MKKAFQASTDMLLSPGTRRRITSFGLLVALVACGSGDVADEKASAPARVDLVAAEPASASRIVSAAGIIRFRNETQLSFTTAGKIATLIPFEGSRMESGSVIGSLDQTRVTADLASVRSQLKQTEREYERIAALYKEGWVTRAQYESTKANVEAAQSSERKAAFDVRTARLHAPSDGIVLSRLANAGQVVAAGETVLIFGEIRGGLILRVPINDRDLAGVKRGSSVEVTSTGLGQATLVGRVTEIGGAPENTTGSVLVTIALPFDHRLVNGQLAAANFRMSKSASAQTFQIPESALFDVRAGEGFVFVAEDRPLQVDIRRVKIIALGEDGIEVSGDLKPGDMIVAKGVEGLETGQQVISASSPS